MTNKEVQSHLDQTAAKVLPVVEAVKHIQIHNGTEIAVPISADDHLPIHVTKRNGHWYLKLPKRVKTTIVNPPKVQP